MKVVFVNPPTDSEYPKPPLGLLQVATACQEAGHDVRILDADLLKLSPMDIVDVVADADIVGLTALTPTYPMASRIACLLKAETGVRTMIGGVHASIFPETLRDTGLWDIVVVGEGEAVVAADAMSLNGIFTWPSLSYTDIPTPDYSLLDVSAYLPRYPHGARTPWTAVHTSRGCPFQCTFCSKAVFGSKYRAMPADRLCGLLRTLVEVHGIRDITFYDDEFTLDNRRLSMLCLGLEIDQYDLTWTCEARVDMVNYQQFEMMKAAGCRLIYFGLESGNQDILNTLRKNTTLEQARSAVALCHEAGIQAAAYFMLGAPGETMQSIQDTLDFAEELALDHAQFSICTPLPGSQLYAEYGNKSSGRYLGCGAKPVMVSGAVAERVVEAVEEGNQRWARV